MCGHPRLPEAGEINKGDNLMPGEIHAHLDAAGMAAWERDEQQRAQVAREHEGWGNANFRARSMGPRSLEWEHERIMGARSHEAERERIEAERMESEQRQREGDDRREHERRKVNNSSSQRLPKERRSGRMKTSMGREVVVIVVEVLGGRARVTS